MRGAAGVLGKVRDVSKEEDLAAEIRRRLGPPPVLSDWPLVSIVVLNRDGAGLLRRLLRGLAERTDYPKLELILVDNASGDDSLDFIRAVEAPFPISIVANAHNESFSDACNQGAELASGELLLFLNNDVEPFESGWLRELVACLRAPGTGVVAPTSVHPQEEVGTSSGFVVQHRGMRFRDQAGVLRPVLRDLGSDPLGEGFGDDVESAAVNGVCQLISAELYDEVGGLTRGYLYGAEDIDICFKVRGEGLRPLCSGRSFMVHHPGSDRHTDAFAYRREWNRRNHRLLLERWAPLMRREFELDRLVGAGVWAAPPRTTAQTSSPPTLEEATAPSFCLKSGDRDPTVAAPLDMLSRDLSRRGHRCLVLKGDGIDDPVGLQYDVDLHLRGRSRYVVQGSQMKVLWIAGPPDTVTSGECRRYDLVVTDEPRSSGRLLDGPTPVVALSGTDAGALIAAVTARGMALGLTSRFPLGSAAGLVSRV